MPRSAQRHPWLYLAVMVFMTPWAGRAHQPGLSTVYVDLGTNRIHAQLILAWQELEETVLIDANHDRVLTEAEFTAAKGVLLKLAEPSLSIESDGRMLALTQPVAVRREDATGIRFDLEFEFPPTRVLTINSEIIAELPRGHSQIVTVRGSSGLEIGHAMLDRDQPSVDVPLFAIKEKTWRNRLQDLWWRTAEQRQFLVLGIEHIVTGWDHMAFLFGLLVVGGGLKDALKIITSFTLAHSLTLALATLNVVNIPSSVVEPLIAASIVYVGFENIVRSNFDKRWILTFAFGMVHGCGFASVLRELGVGANGSSVVTPLIFFNLGVEVGQLAIATVMLPLIWKLKPRFPNRWLPVTSVGLIVLGSYFFIERVWPRDGGSQNRTSRASSLRCAESRTVVHRAAALCSHNHPLLSEWLPGGDPPQIPCPSA